MGYLQETIIDT